MFDNYVCFLPFRNLVDIDITELQQHFFKVLVSINVHATVFWYMRLHFNNRKMCFTCTNIKMPAYTFKFEYVNVIFSLNIN